MKPKPNILFLVPESYCALERKGVVHLILERGEDGFFQHVTTVHPLAFKNQKIELNAQHTIYEFNFRNFFYPNKFWLLTPFLPITFLFMIIKLIKLIRREKIDLIRSTDPYLMGFIAWILHRATKIPFCISIHSDYDLVFALAPKKGFKAFLRTCAKWLPDFVSPKAQLLLPISHYLKKAISKKVSSDRIKVISHGVDFNFVPDKNIREKFDLPLDKKIISFVGRFSDDNYLDDILYVTEKLSLIRNDFTMVLVGGGELESKVHQWLDNHPNAKSMTRLLGFQPNHIGRSLRHVSTISLCLMSGFSLIEAAAAETPLISYNVEWHGELVENHVTGFLIKERDRDAVFDSICYLLDHPEEAIIMGKNAHNKAYANHDIVKTSMLKQKYYLSLLDETASCSS